MSSSRPVKLPVSPGDVIAGKYRVDRVLGVGGMGFVVAATHLRLDHSVAIKLLLEESLGKPETVARFAREARAAVKLRGDHVVRVTDVGELDNGSPYIVMEYLDGDDLAGVVKTNGPLPIADAVDYVLQACEGVAEAHALGMVHRDIKPANLFLTRQRDGSPVVKLVDFGITKSSLEDLSGRDVTLTQTETVMGSPVYMSPEQLRSSRDVDARTDIWSLGIVLYQLLVAKMPFASTSAAGLIARIASEPPIAIETLRPEVPEALRGVILRCLEKNREQRFSDVADLALALAPFASGRGSFSAKRARAALQSSADTMALAPTLAAPSSPRVTESMSAEGPRSPTPEHDGTKSGLSAAGVDARATTGRRLAAPALLATTVAVIAWIALRPPTPTESPRATTGSVSSGGVAEAAVADVPPVRRVSASSAPSRDAAIPSPFPAPRSAPSSRTHASPPPQRGFDLELK